MDDTIFWQIDTNFWKLENGIIHCLNHGTKTIAETSTYTPIGAYTSFRTYESFGVLRLKKHLDRLEETARLAGHDIHLDRENLKDTLTALLAVSRVGEKRIRVTIDLENKIGTIYIAMEPLKIPAPDKYTKGIICKTTEAHRENPKAKLSSFLSRAEGIREENEGPIDEILMATPEGDLLEGLSSNFFGISSETIYTAEEGVLSGTTRDFILKIASELNVLVIFKPINLKNIGDLDEAFISSTSRAILPIRSINGITMKQSVPGPVTSRLMSIFSEKLSAGIEKLYE